MAQSAFRLLGLAASASQREVYDAATRLRLALRVGVANKFESDLLWLAPLGRDDAGVRDALSRLGSPVERAAERLCWFYDGANFATPETVAALEAEAERRLTGKGAAVVHDAALLLLAGLHRLDSELRERECWARAFALWRQLCEGEEFWSLLVAADLKGGFEPTVTFAEVAELRAGAPRLISAPIAEYARTAALDGRYEAARRALDVLRAARLPPQLLAEYEDEVIGPLDDRLDPLFDEIFGAPEVFYGAASESFKRGAYGHALARVERELKPALRALLEVAGPQHYSTHRACSEAARRLAALAGGWLELNERKRARDLLKLALTVAPPAAPERLEIGERLRELDSTGETEAADVNIAEGETAAEEYEAAALRELGREMPDWAVEEQGGGLSRPSLKRDLRGCLTVVLFYLLVIGACAVTQKCGYTKFTGGSRRHSPAIDVLRNFNMPELSYTPSPRISIPPPLRLTRRVSPSELRALLKAQRAVVVDVRPRAEYEAGHLPGALWLPEEEVEKRYRTVLRGKRLVVFYCDCPDDLLADRIAMEVRIRGLVDVAVLEGGYRAWLESENSPGATTATPTPTPGTEPADDRNPEPPAARSAERAPRER